MIWLWRVRATRDRITTWASLCIPREGGSGSGCISHGANWFLGDDVRDSFTIESIELLNFFALHFVIYGVMNPGVSRSTSIRRCLLNTFAIRWPRFLSRFLELKLKLEALLTSGFK
jgi:hypothetical protein